jgi:hypothetical protein
VPKNSKQENLLRVLTLTYVRELFAECIFVALDKANFYRVYFCRVFFATLGKVVFCRMRDRMHLANSRPLGKQPFYGNVHHLITMEDEINPVYIVLN